MEPTPASVSSSMRMECFFRPSRIWALLTPLRTAWTQQSILGIMPPEMTPSLMSAGTSLTRRALMRVEAVSYTHLDVYKRQV